MCLDGKSRGFNKAKATMDSGNLLGLAKRSIDRLAQASEHA